MTTEIIEHTLETWQAGVANGYYEPHKDEIHILKAEELYRKILAHENVHASRKEKTTFQLASLIAVPAVSNLLFGAMIVLAIFGIFEMSQYGFSQSGLISFIPYFFVTGIFVVLLMCQNYEEYIANITVQKSIKQLKNGGETPK